MHNDPDYAVTHKMALARFMMLATVAIVTVMVYFYARVLVVSHGRRDVDIRRRVTIAEMKRLKIAIETFHLDTDRYPTTAEGLEALVVRPKDAPGWIGPYLEQVPEDKWGHPYHYTFPSATDPTTYDLHSSGADGMDDNADDILKDTEE